MHPAGAARPALSSLSILIPCYNEASTVETVISGVVESHVGLRKELIVVDDGSTDGSAAIITGVQERYRERGDAAIVVERHAVNRGKGAAVRTALARATGDAVLIQDADLEYDPADYPALLAPLIAGEAAIVYGSRQSRRFRIGQPRQWRFIAAAWALTRLANVLFGARLTDYATGYKAFTREVADRLSLRSGGFEIDAEITAQALRLGYRIVEVPIRYRPRSVAQGKKIRAVDGWRAAVTLVRERFRP
jgi:glycosyltransferase involved in cell wall biosynthesis